MSVNLLNIKRMHRQQWAESCNMTHCITCRVYVPLEEFSTHGNWHTELEKLAEFAKRMMTGT